ncbi:MAG: phosphate-starvation-inducible PsiE family protein [Sulfuricaulis sp.]|uniref:phosphate-starvation-inducible PsiE family protein n=1 Tax=Sulfuricaulis sp. TaxID=2003553 RepID=UPI0025D2D6B6|nr:phosphate-starvation-inducible PsiE family protein [Sulfuricaulis sp.]MCR4346756.1 phosphate-starvation-inducible PsiE family protein [Sulfuricaulis sp.]
MSMISSRHYAWRFLTSDFYSRAIRAVTGLLIAVLCLWMIAGILNMLMAFMTIPESSWTDLAEHTIINSLIMLALLEVIRTLQAYLTLGRVRVTFILDTALVVLIGELMGLWFREYAPEKVLLGLGVIVALVVLRIVTARFSPETAGDAR